MITLAWLMFNHPHSQGINPSWMQQLPVWATPHYGENGPYQSFILCSRLQWTDQRSLSLSLRWWHRSLNCFMRRIWVVVVSLSLSSSLLIHHHLPLSETDDGFWVLLIHSRCGWDSTARQTATGSGQIKMNFPSEAGRDSSSRALLI